MALLCQKVRSYDDENTHLEVEKSLLIGLLADIGIYSAVKAYQAYTDEAITLILKLPAMFSIP